LNQDIRYIDTSNFKVTRHQRFLIQSTAFLALYLGVLLLAFLLFFIFRKQARENANLALRRTKKANKMALKRLKTASMYLKENNKERFYEEILKALWGFMSDKLNILTADLTKQAMEVSLLERNVDVSIVQRLMDLLNTSEFAQYAPATSPKSMKEIFDEAVALIELIDNKLK
jgi:signal recognition particle GTPase